jgi:hypothetical protein
MKMREVLKAIEPPKPKPPAQDSEEVEEESTYLGATRTAPYQPKRTLEEHRARETQAEEQTDEVVQGEVVEEEAKVKELVSDVIEGRRGPEDLGEYVRTGDTDVEDVGVFVHFSDEERSLLDTFQSGGGIVVNMHDPGPHRNLVAWLKATDQLTKADRSTKWGNPFIIPDDGDRETVVRKYGEIYLPYKTGLLE